MTDIYEQASDEEEKFREASLARQRSRSQLIEFNGRCLYCNEQIKVGRFCPQEDCGEQWEFEQKMKGIMGKK